MPRANPHRPFTPHPEQAALAPAVSGDAINGLGEAERRPARMVYWAPDPDAIPHGKLQRWFYTRDPGDPHLAKARAERAAILAEEIGPLAETRAERAPEDWTAAFLAMAGQGRFELAGVAEMRPEYLLEGCEIAESRVLMLGVAHDYDAISAAPATVAGAEVVRQYGRAGAAAKAVASWLRAEGWEARPVTGPMTGALLMIPPALDCGFGELGKHGSIINDRYGSSFRLAAVLTDAPFAPTPRREFGADGFCLNCRVCEDACPPEAIGPVKRLVRGETKWYVEFDRCLPYFNERQGCAICLAVCPWSRPGAGLDLAAKLARRRARAGKDRT